MTKKEHLERHQELHKKLDELVADFTNHNVDKQLNNTSVMELIEWSHQETINPTEIVSGGTKNV